MAGEGTFSLEERLTEKRNITRARVDKRRYFCYDKYAWRGKWFTLAKNVYTPF